MFGSGGKSIVRHMRIAATADLHFSPNRANSLKEQLAPVRDQADLLVVAGDLTNYGQPAEMEPLLNVLVPARSHRRRPRQS